ncbi:MAG TPA: hypothetical protein VE819_05235, partial [Steroidobacteraceae bacterium]|nr:hypothetical protein [Steroidobacteraceae bacterium]
LALGTKAIRAWRAAPQARLLRGKSAPGARPAVERRRRQPRAHMDALIEDACKRSKVHHNSHSTEPSEAGSFQILRDVYFPKVTSNYF